MAVWVAVAAAAVSAMGALQKGESQASQYEANAKANDYNAAVLRQRAETVKTYAAARGSLIDTTTNLSEEQNRMQSRLTAGSRQAAIAQSGTGVDTGSNDDINRQAEIFAELDALNIRYAGQLEKHDVLQQANLEAADLESDANLAQYGGQVNRMSAGSARTAGQLGAVGAVLGGTGDYMRMRSPGGGGPAPKLYMSS